MSDAVNIVRAETSGMEVLIWLVVTIIWIVAQLVSKSRKDRGPTPAPPTRPPAPGLSRIPSSQPSKEPQDIEEFFERLREQFEAGEVQPLRTPPSPPPAAPRLATSPAAPAAVRPKAQPAGPRHKPKPTAPPPPPRPPLPAQIPVVVPETSTSPSPPGYTAPQVSFEAIRRDILSLKVGFSSRGLRLADVRTTSKFHRRASPSIQRLFHGRDGLKKALIAKQVLGAPRSLRPWLYPED